MSLPDFWGRIKARLRPGPELSNVETIELDGAGNPIHLPLWRKLFLALVIILVASLSFGIGRLSVGGEREPIRIEYDASMTNREQTANALNAVGKPDSQPLAGAAVVVSKNGSKYHYAHCSGAKQIKEENKLIFDTAKAAEAAGYTLAANCLPK